MAVNRCWSWLIMAENPSGRIWKVHPFATNIMPTNGWFSISGCFCWFTNGFTIWLPIERKPNLLGLFGLSQLRATCFCPIMVEEKLSVALGETQKAICNFFLLVKTQKTICWWALWNHLAPGDLGWRPTAWLGTIFMAYGSKAMSISEHWSHWRFNRFMRDSCVDMAQNSLLDVEQCDVMWCSTPSGLSKKKQATCTSRGRQALGYCLGIGPSPNPSEFQPPKLAQGWRAQYGIETPENTTSNEHRPTPRPPGSNGDADLGRKRAGGERKRAAESKRPSNRSLRLARFGAEGRGLSAPPTRSHAHTHSHRKTMVFQTVDPVWRQ